MVSGLSLVSTMIAVYGIPRDTIQETVGTEIAVTLAVAWD